MDLLIVAGTLSFDELLEIVVFLLFGSIFLFLFFFGVSLLFR